MDAGFIGFNNYNRPDQLTSGMLASSSNGRIGKNGEWQVRKGINVIKAPFASGDGVLRLPTNAEILVNPTVVGLLPTTIRSASLDSTSSKVSIVIDDPAVDPGHVFIAGDEVYVENFVSTTTDPNGLHTITDVTDNGTTITIKYALTGANETYGTALTLPFSLNDAGVQPALTVLTESPVIGFNMIFDQGAVTAVYSSATFSDPNQDNNQFIVLASNISAVATDLNDTSVSITMGYPLNENVPPASSMLQAFNKLFIFRDGQTALENDNFFSPIAISSASTPAASNVVTVSSNLPHGLAIGDAITISGLTNFVAGEDPNGTWVVNTVPSTTSFTYDLPAAFQAAATYTVSALSLISPGFKLVASGAYSQPTQLSPSRVDIVDGRATATFSSAVDMNGTKVGDTIEIEAVGNSPLIEGEDYIISERTESPATLYFYVQHEDVSNAQGVIFQQHVSQGLGFTHMPAPEYAAYHQRRLVMPFKYSVDDAVNTFTYRKILDEVIISDILDSDTYDQIYGQYRFNAGTADFNVALHSFSDDKLLVFNRNSIHLVSGAGQGASVQLITNEVGCVARQSIVQIGNNVMFLSDNGVYGANFQDLYNLRGNEVPLSSSINPTIERINRSVWDKSVAVYFDNRYYIAVPLDGSQVNNAILIFNFLNKQWESIDTTAAANWNIANLIVAGKKNARAVYAVNTLGGLHKLDARVDAVDLLATEIPVEGQEVAVQHDIPASVTTRQFTMGTMNRKRWNSFELHVQSSVDNESDLSISAELENIDAVVELGTLNKLNSGTNLAIDEDVSVRGRIGNNRAYGMQVTLNNTVGRPRFRAIKVSAAEAFRSTNKAI